MSDSSSFKVVSLADLVVDVIINVPSLPVEAAMHQATHGLQMEPGGAGNFLIAGARLGMNMKAYGAVGQDAFGDSLKEMLDAEGVDMRGVVQQPDGETNTVFVLEDDAHQHVFLGQNGEGETLLFSDEWRNAIEGADAVQAWGYSLHEPRVSAAMMAGMKYAYARNIPVFFDPGPLIAGVPEDQRKEALSFCNVVLLTEDEVPLLTGGRVGLDGARGLLTQGPDMVCVKRGNQGCIVLASSEIVEHHGFKVPVVDTSAAGDSFDAAFIYARLRGWPLQKVAAFANAMGAAKVQKFGSGRQVPTAEEVRKVLNDFDVGVDF